MGFTLRCKKAFDVCIGHDQITDHEVEQLHYFLCVRSVIFKMTSGDTPDATLMNRHVAELVDRAISSTYSGKSFNFDEQPTDDIQMLFSDEFIEKLKRIPYPNTKYQALVNCFPVSKQTFYCAERMLYFAADRGLCPFNDTVPIERIVRNLLQTAGTAVDAVFYRGQMLVRSYLFPFLKA